MGQSTNGILAYGYDLGGSDSEWKVREAGEYGELVLDWHGEDAEDDFASAAEQRLLDASGFTETDLRAEGYFDREREAKAALGIEVETYCSGECPMYLLAAKVITVHRGDIKPIDMVELVEAPAVHGWDEKLRAALGVLGLTPTQERAQWLLASYWG